MKKAKLVLGFTLVELVMTIALLGIISAVASRFIVQAFTSLRIAQDIDTISLPALTSLERLNNDIHSINNPTKINIIQSNSFSYNDNSGNSVQYIFSGSTLTRNGVLMADNVQSMTFTYYDKNGAVTATIANIQSIGLSLTLRLNNLPLTLATTTALRYQL